MLRGMYLSATGMSAGKKYLDVLTNNIVNANTPGFRSKRLSVSQFGQEVVQRMAAGRSTPVGHVDQGPAIQESILSPSSGSMTSTGRPLDIAITDGSTFMAVQTSHGTSYRRGGSLSVNGDGVVTDANGNPVMGHKGPIRVERGTATTAVTVTGKGEVMVGGNVVDVLALYSMDSGTVEWTSDGLVTGDAKPISTPAENTIVGGAIEQSNVDIVRELNELIRTSRLYQVNQSVLKVQDEALRTALARVGELS